MRQGGEGGKVVPKVGTPCGRGRTKKITRSASAGRGGREFGSARPARRLLRRQPATAIHSQSQPQPQLATLLFLISISLHLLQTLCGVGGGCSAATPRLRAHPLLDLKTYQKAADVPKKVNKTCGENLAFAKSDQHSIKTVRFSAFSRPSSF